MLYVRERERERENEQERLSSSLFFFRHVNIVCIHWNRVNRMFVDCVKIHRFKFRIPNAIRIKPSINEWFVVRNAMYTERSKKELFQFLCVFRKCIVQQHVINKRWINTIRCYVNRMKMQHKISWFDIFSSSGGEKNLRNRQKDLFSRFRSVHPPPETTSISLVLKLMAMLKQVNWSREVVFSPIEDDWYLES